MDRDRASVILNASAAILELRQHLQRTPCVRVSVQAHQGSVPRETGAWMLVTADQLRGTVGGGQLELQAIQKARGLLGTSMNASHIERYPLGPSLGQCCGGVVHLQFESFVPADTQRIDEVVVRLNAAVVAQRTPVALFGGGHVGHAIVQALAPLPFAVRWVDSRDEIFPTDLPLNVSVEHSNPVHAAVHDLSTQSRVLTMSFSHAEDLDIVAACLQRHREQADLPFIGLIGSRTKWARFRNRLLERGFTELELAHITSPIGLPGIVGKQPEVIAASVAAQLLQLVSAQRQTLPPAHQGH